MSDTNHDQDEQGNNREEPQHIENGSARRGVTAGPNVEGAAAEDPQDDVPVEPGPAPATDADAATMRAEPEPGSEDAGAETSTPPEPGPAAAEGASMLTPTPLAATARPPPLPTTPADATLGPGPQQSQEVSPIPIPISRAETDTETAPAPAPAPGRPETQITGAATPAVRVTASASAATPGVSASVPVPAPVPVHPQGSRRRQSVLAGMQLQRTISTAEEFGFEGNGDRGAKARKVIRQGKSQDSDAGSIEYDQADFISEAYRTQGSIVPIGILQFEYSFGYDCQKHGNLCVLDSNTIAFVSGNLVHFYDVAEKKMTFRRSALGTGLGHIAKNPAEPHFAVGEKGVEPFVVVYEWPSMSIVAVLTGGAESVYTHLGYSQDGELLCSVAGPPDYYFTVWDWRRSRTVLRAKSTSQDTFSAAFSGHMPGCITSAGSAHIRFWKMAETFTGLKLTGEPGRFGNTEVSDVLGFLAMPDGKVVSGCEWGNILVWEAGLIKLEVTKKGRRSCHAAPVTQFEYSNGELVTAGMDGFVKVWYFETIDLADPPDDDRFVEVEPIFELEVGDEFGPAALMCMHRQDPADERNNTWYAQDGGGGLWSLDLSMATEAAAPRRLWTSHSAAVVGLACAPHAPYVATLGREGRLHVYSTSSSSRRTLVIAKAFPSEGHALLWLPVKVASSGAVLVLANADGVVRVVAVDLAAAERQAPEHGGTALGTSDLATLVQASKAHREAATTLALSDSGHRLASGGADRAVFIFAVESGTLAALSPIGFVEIPQAVSFLAFKRNFETKLLTGCVRGHVVEIQVPENPTHDASVSFRYTEATFRHITYKSIKSEIKREEYMKNVRIKKEEKLAKKKQRLEELKEENPGTEIDEDAFLGDSDSEEEMEPLYIPAVLGDIRWAMYLTDDRVLLSVTGYDAGFLYEYQFDKEDPLRATVVPGGNDDLEVSSYLVYQDQRYLFLGMGDGVVRCVGVKTDRVDLRDYWSLGMHDADAHKGPCPVTCLAATADGTTLFSAGPDGNIFMYSIHPEGRQLVAQLAQPAPLPTVVAAEELYADVPTLEDQSAKAERDRRMRVAAERKHRVEQVLWQLAETYNNIIRRNRALPPSQMLPASELELDPRITENCRQQVQAETDLQRRKMAFVLERARLQYHKLASFYTDAVDGHGITVPAIRKDAFVETIRQRKLTGEFEAAAALVQLKIEEAERRGRQEEREVSLEEAPEELVLAPAPVESFLRGINSFESRFNARLRRLLDKYHSRKMRRERRQAEWAHFMRKKPDMNRNDPEDESAIREAEETIGDYKLKSDPDYRVPANEIVTTAKKYRELLQVRKQLNELVGTFNAEVVSLRERKARLAERMAVQTQQLGRMHRELPYDLHDQPPEPPDINRALEYPEKLYQVCEEEIEAELEKTAPQRRAPKPQKFLQEEGPDPELEVLMGDRDVCLMGACASWENVVEELAGPSGPGELQRVDSDVDIASLKSMGEDDAVNTPWENERRAARLIRKVWEQEQLLAVMHREIDALDAAVEALADRRLLVRRDAALLRHRLLVLHQELIIIKACEDREETLSSKVADKERDKRTVLNELTNIQNKVDSRNRDIVRCQEREKEIQLVFSESVGEYQFKDYLRRVFRKKYRPPRGSSASSEDTSSMSESEEGEEGEEVEEGSLESGEIGPMRFDDTFCPPGCSQELFDLAIRLREQRHEVERDITEHNRLIEALRKEHDGAQKKLRAVEALLVQKQEDLVVFQREKQQRLNEVETVVILRLSQLQHSLPDPAKGFEKLNNTLVFKTSVLAGLDRRVSQLNEEAQAQRAKQKKNRTHFHRMLVDIRFMKERSKQLRLDIQEAHYRKFGHVIDVTEMEQALLRRFIWDLRSSSDDIRAEFADLIRSMKEEVRNKFVELMKTIEQNTQRQNLLLVLIEERNRLLRASARSKGGRGRGGDKPDRDRESAADQVQEGQQEQGASEVTVDAGASPYEEDVAKLRELVLTLTRHRNQLLAEAVRLRQKGTLPPLLRPDSTVRASSAGRVEGGGGGGAGGALGLGSVYHGGCGGLTLPPPPKPWPPSCVTALKHPMYLGETPHGAARAGAGARAVPPSTPTTARSLAARREAVREKLESGERPVLQHPHPHPTARRSLSLDSLSQALSPGALDFLSADFRDLPPIPPEEELSLAPPRDEDEDEDGQEQNNQALVETLQNLQASHESMEELFRRASQSVQEPVDQFLERLATDDGAEAMMELLRRDRGDREDQGDQGGQDGGPPSRRFADQDLTSDEDGDEVEGDGGPDMRQTPRDQDPATDDDQPEQ